MEPINHTRISLTAFLTALGITLGWKGVLVLAWVCLMTLDYFTGTCAALKAGSWCSRTAREGAWHKCGAIIVVAVAGIADAVLAVACGNIPLLNIHWPGILLPLLLAWYILTELGSILENAIKLGANPPAWLTKILKSSLNIVESVGDAAAEQKDTDTAEQVAAVVNEILSRGEK